MRLIGNLIWIVFGGLAVCLEYLIAGLVLCVTIVGIPWGMQCFKIAVASLTPFGISIQSSSQQVGCLNFVLNIIWIIFAGIWIAATHLFFGVILAITILGLPFAKQHFKLMRLSFAPFGKEIN